jgi:membrane-bound lytic murein transglycosylase C
MKFEHFIIALLMPAGLLLIAGGAAFQHFQDWTHLPGQVQAAAPVTNTPSPTSTPVKSLSTSLSVEPVNQTVVVQALERTLAQTDAVLLSTRSPNATPMRPHRAEPAQHHAPDVVAKPTELGAPASLAGAREDNPQPTASATLAEQPGEVELVRYQDELVLAFPQALASEQTIKRAIARVLLSTQPLDGRDLLSTESIDYRQRPYLYRRVLDQAQQPIRYPRAAYRYADYLMARHRVEVEDNEGRFVHIHIPLVPSNLAEPARRYEPWVLAFAEQFNVSAALIFAIMETESHFNPLAVSRSNAKGLMQIKPDAAGRDVYQYIDFKLGAPGDAELFDAQSNIRLGTAYLSLLKHDYFADIRHAEVREMVAIASYNGGLTTVWRLFGRTPQEAIAHINRLNPRQVYRTLRYEHASDETRRYLDKVLQAKRRYQALLGEDAGQLLAQR